MLQKVKVVTGRFAKINLFDQNRFIEIVASDLALLHLEITENSEFKQEIILLNKKADRKEVYICFKTSKTCVLPFIATVW